MTLTTERLKQLADPNMICKCSWDEYKSMATELLANRAASTARPDSAAPSAGVYGASDSAETIEKNPKSWAAWKREAERLQAIIDANREAQPVNGELGEISVGNLPTMNQEEYPGLGDWWVQLRIGANHDEILARVYGATPEEAVARARLLTAPPAPAVPEEMKRDPDADVFDPGFMNGWNACRAAMLAQPVSQGYKLPDSVLVLLNHIEDVLDDENWNRISVKKWNAVTMLAAAPGGGNG